MRVAVVFFGSGRRDSVLDIARGIAAGIESQGHTVDLIDAEKDPGKTLTMYEYIAVGARATSVFGGKLPGSITEFLETAGMISGKKCFAFLLRGPFGGGKALTRLMGIMERQGMFIRYSEIIRSADEARVIGSRLKIEP